MCRFVAYLGPEITLDTLVTRPRHSLIRQSYACEEREEPLNGDGFGVGWYAPDVSPEPAVFRAITPAWSNRNLLHLARVTRTRCAFAHVRAATPGLAVTETNCHPFQSGRLLFMHNGLIAGFATSRRALLSRLSEASFQGIEGTTDSEHAFALLLDAYTKREGEEPAERLAAAVAEAIAAIADLGGGAPGQASQLNFAVTDGAHAAFTRFTDGDPERANSLYVHAGKGYAFDGQRCRMDGPDDPEGRAVLVSSERLSDDTGWDRVPPNHLVLVSGGRVARMEPLAMSARAG